MSFLWIVTITLLRPIINNFSNVFFLIKSIIEHTINTIYTLSSISPNNATPEIPALLKTTAHNQSLTYLLSCIKYIPNVDPAIILITLPIEYGMLLNDCINIINKAQVINKNIGEFL